MLKLQFLRARLKLLVIIAIVVCAVLCISYYLKGMKIQDSVKNYYADEVIDFSAADNVTGFSSYVVPNLVHFINFDTTDLSFIQVVDIKAAYLNQKPDKIYIHCNCDCLKGKYWDMVKNISVLEVVYLKKPTHVFGKKLSQVYHASDVARIEVLMKYGGIFLDSDTYVVQSLDYFRHFEMSLGWPINQFLGTQILLAHKDARFLRLWYDSYRNYRGNLWYYNAGELPTTSILYERPYLVHREPLTFGVHMLVHLLYRIRSPEWKNFHAIHLLVRHKSYLVKDDYVKDLNEENIKTYNKTFGEMARLVLYGTTDFV